MSRKNYTSRAARLLPALAFTLVIALCYPGRAVLAAPGDLDTSFDSDGKLTTDLIGTVNARAVVVQPDGKIVVAGRDYNFLTILRYNADGSLDQSFGTGGRVTAEGFGFASGANAVALQPDGKIVAAGFAGADLTIMRYNADGTGDMTFGTGGKVAADFGATEDARALAIQPDGRIVVAVRRSSTAGPPSIHSVHFVLARYLADGKPDTTFGFTAAQTSFPFDGIHSSAEAVALQPDGKIIAAGTVGSDFAVVRLTSDGHLDRTFNTGGRQVFGFTAGAGETGTGEVSFDRTDRATAVAVQPDGRILVGGSVQTTNNVFSPALARLRPDGRLDASFSGNGLAVFRQDAGLDSFFTEQWVGLTLQPNGKAVAVSRGNNFNVLRVNLDGQLDQTFGGDGIVTTDFDPATRDSAEAVAVGPDGRIVVVGTTPGADFGSDVAVARYLGDAPDVQCVYGLSRANHVVPGPGGSASVHVFAPAGCAWTAASNVPWITIPVPAAGAGDRVVSFTVEPSGPGIRTGTLTIAGQTFTVGQNGFKVAVYYGGGQNLGEQVRAAIAGTGLFAQVDSFSLHPVTTPTISHLLQYDSVFYFHNNATGPPQSNQTALGDVLAFYVERGRGVVIAGLNWDGLDHIKGGMLTGRYLPFMPVGGFASSAPLVKLQPAHPVLSGVSSLSSGGHSPLTMTTNSQRLADWGDGRPAVGTKQPYGGRVVGLNFFPTFATGEDRARLMANSLHWAASGPATHSTFAFSAASVAASEGAPGAAVSVSRSGPDLSDSATVEFSTVDSAAVVRCDAVTGVALARCDYSTTVQTLTFAPGETQKIVHVSLVDDGHVEGQETVELRLTRPFGAGLGQQVTSNIVINDNDAAGAPNPLDGHAFFVRQHYLDFLSREPEESGQSAWVSLLANCPDANNDPRCDRPTVSSSFFRASESHLKGYYAFRFYRAGLARLPAYSEIAADMGALTGATSSEVFQKRAVFATAFTERADFLSRFPLSISHAAYVNGLLDAYGLQSIRTRDPEDPEAGAEVTLTKTDLTNGLANGTLTRAQVVRAFVESREVSAAEFNGAFVAMQYYGYLRRAPEQPGYQNWLNYLDAHPTDFRMMIKGFIDSVEYRLRFGQP